MRQIAFVLSAMTMALSASPALACPYCSEGIRKQVIAGVFDERFGHHVLFTVAPFVIFGALTAAIHFSGPQRVEHRTPADDDTTTDDEAN